MSLGIAFEGCAGRAAFAAGVADQLHAGGVRPGCVAGASSGAIVAVLVAGGYAGRIAQIWLAAAGQPVFQPARMLRGGWPLAMSSIVGDALEDVFGSRRLAELGLPVAIPVTLLGVGGRRRRVLTRADDLTIVEAVLASCFIPGPYSRRVSIDGHTGWDGAWQIRTPVADAIRLGASRVLAVVANTDGALRLGFPSRRAAPAPPGCTVVAPSAPLPVGSWDTNSARIRAAIRQGRSAARRLREGTEGTQPP